MLSRFSPVLTPSQDRDTIMRMVASWELIVCLFVLMYFISVLTVANRLHKREQAVKKFIEQERVEAERLKAGKNIDVV
jgi:hypothetical protein